MVIVCIMLVVVVLDTQEILQGLGNGQGKGGQGGGHGTFTGNPSDLVLEMLTLEVVQEVITVLVDLELLLYDIKFRI